MAPLIGLYSPAPQSGKSTLAKAMGPLGYNVVRFAGPLKGMLRAFLLEAGADHGLVNRMIDGDLKETPSTYLQGRTPRHAMQTLGTEWGRGMIGDSLWVSAAIAQANWLREQGIGVVIDDMRFPNEAQAVAEAGGLLVRIHRPIGAVDCTGHASEGALEDWPFHVQLTNGGCVYEWEGRAPWLDGVAQAHNERI